MKTINTRHKDFLTLEGRVYAKEKTTFKVIQVVSSMILNLVFFYYVVINYLDIDVIVRMFEIFVAVLLISLATNGMAVIIVIAIYNDPKAKRIVMMDGSYVKFFLVSIVYSLVTSVAFAFGAFWIVFSAFGDGTISSLAIAYLIAYVICDYFAYGIVTYFYNLTREYY